MAPLGRIPLGYDLGNRRLTVNAAEAENVRLIFRRYLDLGCVRALKDDLADRGIASKCWTSNTGVTYGGTPFDRGALYCLLRNRIYIGEVTHKGAAYPGEHKAIVPRDLFEAVQQRLASVRRRQKGKKSSAQDAPLAGAIATMQASPPSKARARQSRFPVYQQSPWRP